MTLSPFLLKADAKHSDLVERDFHYGSMTLQHHNLMFSDCMLAVNALMQSACLQMLLKFT
jgi:hypothetical protein